MSKDNKIYLQHIYDCTQKIEEYTANLDKEEFLQTSMVQDAVIRQFEIIGEATKNLSASFREKNSELPWKKMAGMRDKLIHDYIGVDLWMGMGGYFKRYTGN